MDNNMFSEVNQILSIISSIDENIKNKTITIEDLKSLLLITFNECLANDQPNPVIKSYLTVAILHFITLENEYQHKLTNEQNDNSLEEEIISKILHNKAVNSI